MANIPPTSPQGQPELPNRPSEENTDISEVYNEKKYIPFKELPGHRLNSFIMKRGGAASDTFSSICLKASSIQQSPSPKNKS